MKITRFFFCLALLSCQTSQGGEYALQESFVTHLKLGSNADTPATKYKIVVQDWGFNGSVYLPYSTPAGRRIGFGLPVAGPLDYSVGITRQEADLRLRQAVGAAVAELQTSIPGRMPGRSFNELDNARQEVLIDLAMTEGAENVPYEVLDALYNYSSTWREKLGENEAYIRRYGPLLDVMRNRAFAWRHLDNGIHHAGDPAPN